MCNQGDINDYGLLFFEFPYKTIEKINQEFKKQHITGAYRHIVYDDNGITEIIEQERAYQRHTKKLPNNGEVDVFDDGSAVVTDPDGTKHYVEDSSDLKYDEDGNIKDVTSTQSNVVDEKTLPDGKKVTDFDNGKSLVEDPKTGDKYVTDTDDIEYDDNGNIKDDPQSNPSSGNDDKLPDPKDIVVSNDTGSKLLID